MPDKLHRANKGLSIFWYIPELNITYILIVTETFIVCQKQPFVNTKNGKNGILIFHSSLITIIHKLKKII